MTEQATGAMETRTDARQDAGMTAQPAAGMETAQTAKTTSATEQQSAAASKESDEERLNRLIQSKVDRLMAEERKKNANLEKRLKALQKDQLSAEELKRLEMEEKEAALAEKEKALADREHRLYAIKAIKAAGLDDGSDTALELVDFIIGEDEEIMNRNIKAFQALVDKTVAAHVDQTFREHGRVPKGAGAISEAASGQSNVAAQLGKAKAEQQKKSNDVLNYYLGGKK